MILPTDDKIKQRVVNLLSEKRREEWDLLAVADAELVKPGNDDSNGLR